LDLTDYNISRHALVTHEYEAAALAFIAMRGINSWSHGLYSYIAGICYAQLCFGCAAHGDVEKAGHFDQQAEIILSQVQGLLSRRTGRKKVPFDVFCERKIARMIARKKDPSSSFTDCVRGAVIEEVTYLLCNGLKGMDEVQLKKSEEYIRRSVERGGMDEDEECVTAFLFSIVDRRRGEYRRAKERIERDILKKDYKYVFQTRANATDWPAAFAYYEVRSQCD
jgi:hypothetical protein